ncbi:Uncharacterised protein [Haemophilus parahaemolyticus]|uniref:Uncharacterized protein n=1 Tax=Haemophilus parahaemolyticus TaxID=735 RepID=A0A377I200_HAEPH|nr:hypothetical protein [Haemophilus parahaemolyticus]STO64258.1 Uncharacterised protein [Haemophilus parahaemolyticus]
MDLDWQETDIGSKNYKGSFSSKVDEIQSTHMLTKTRRGSLRLDSMPWETRWGRHAFIFRTGVSQKDFDNRNDKEYYVGGYSKENGSIQHPVFIINCKIKSFGMIFFLAN